jgi:hypothetical protein|tara:strand:- start:563 stop:1762 length:1200 start_codon:yes stop_codon:yes gene_type:complete
MANDSDSNASAEDYFNQIFDAHKYKKNRVGRKDDVFYADGSDGLANLKKLYLSFQHVGSQKSIFFKAFITAYNETYTPTWNSETVFGRGDQIHSYVQTQRNIQLSFVVPAASESEAFENLGKVQKLTQFLYPNYHQASNAQTIAQGPLVRLKVMNLLQNMQGTWASTGETGGENGGQPSFRKLKTKSSYYKDYKSKGMAPSHGQLGFISSMTINHNLENRESGVFEKLDPDTNQTVQNTILPKVLEVVVSFTPIHEHTLGWQESNFAEELFPYGVTLYDAGQNKSDSEGGTWESAETAQLNRQKLEQARQAAEARYSGMFGDKGLFGIGGGRLGRDQGRLGKKEGQRGYIKNDAKRAHIAAAVAGEAMNKAGYTDESGHQAYDQTISNAIDEGYSWSDE